MTTTARVRVTLSQDCVPLLPTHVRLKFDEIRQQWAVLAPEKVMWPDEISVEILKRCNGADTIGVIATGLAMEYNAPFQAILSDVLEFLQEWSDRLLIRCRPEGI